MASNSKIKPSEVLLIKFPGVGAHTDATWNTEALRGAVVEMIEDYIRDLGITTPLDAVAIEELIFKESAVKAGYLSLVDIWFDVLKKDEKPSNAETVGTPPPNKDISPIYQGPPCKDPPNHPTDDKPGRSTNQLQYIHVYVMKALNNANKYFKPELKFSFDFITKRLENNYYWVSDECIEDFLFVFQTYFEYHKYDVEALTKAYALEKLFYLEIGKMYEREHEDGKLIYVYQNNGIKPKTDVNYVLLKTQAFSTTMSFILQKFPDMSEDHLIWYLLELGICRKRYEKKIFDYFEEIDNREIMNQIRIWEVKVKQLMRKAEEPLTKEAAMTQIVLTYPNIDLKRKYARLDEAEEIELGKYTAKNEKKQKKSLLGLMKKPRNNTQVLEWLNNNFPKSIWGGCHPVTWAAQFDLVKAVNCFDIRLSKNEYIFLKSGLHSLVSAIVENSLLKVDGTWKFSHAQFIFRLPVLMYCLQLGNDKRAFNVIGQLEILSTVNQVMSTLNYPDNLMNIILAFLLDKKVIERLRFFMWLKIIDEKAQKACLGIYIWSKEATKCAVMQTRPKMGAVKFILDNCESESDILVSIPQPTSTSANELAPINSKKGVKKSQVPPVTAQETNAIAGQKSVKTDQVPISSDQREVTLSRKKEIKKTQDTDLSQKNENTDSPKDNTEGNFEKLISDKISKKIEEVTTEKKNQYSMLTHEKETIEKQIENVQSQISKDAVRKEEVNGAYDKNMTKLLEEKDKTEKQEKETSEECKIIDEEIKRLKERRSSVSRQNEVYKVKLSKMNKDKTALENLIEQHNTEENLKLLNQEKHLQQLNTEKVKKLEEIEKVLNCDDIIFNEPSTEPANISGNIPLLEFINSSIKNAEKDLECPVCLEVASKPIFQCPDSHIICSSCLHSITVCPTCRFQYVQPVKRHRYAEKDLEELERLYQKRNDILQDV